MAGALTVEQSRALNRIITDLLVQAEASVVLLTDIGGNVLAQAPRREDPRLLTMAALAAGAFSATRELADLTGETGFRAVAHEGEKSSLFVQALDANYLLVIVFQRTTTLGLVKLYARRSAQEASDVLAAVPEQTSSGVAPATRFALANPDSDVFAAPAPAATAAPV